MKVKHYDIEECDILNDSRIYIGIQAVHVVQRVVNNSRMTQNSDYFIVCL